MDRCLRRGHYTYDLNGGTSSTAIVDSNNYSDNDTVSVTSLVPELRGHIFRGWKNDSDVYISGSTFNISGNTTLTAQWEKKKYTIDYEGYPDNSFEVWFNDEYGKLLQPSDPDNDFAGWFSEPNGNGQLVTENRIADDDSPKILYPKWYPKGEPQEFRLFYDMNPNDASTTPLFIIDNTQVTSGAAITVTSIVPTKENYSFNSWNTEKNGQGITYNSGANIIMLSNVVLYAQWDIISQPPVNHTVIFDANGGSPTPQNQIVAHRGYILEPNDPSRDGFAFNGWHLTGNVWNFNTDKVIADITLVARWEPINTDTYSVIYDLNGGTGNIEDKNIYKKGDRVYVLTEKPVRQGKNFVSWNTKRNGSGITYLPGSVFIIQEHVMLYAQYSDIVTTLPNPKPQPPQRPEPSPGVTQVILSSTPTPGSTAIPGSTSTTAPTPMPTPTQTPTPMPNDSTPSPFPIPAPSEVTEDIQETEVELVFEDELGTVIIEADIMIAEDEDKSRDDDEPDHKLVPSSETPPTSGIKKEIPQSDGDGRFDFLSEFPIKVIIGSLILLVFMAIKTYRER